VVNSEAYSWGFAYSGFYKEFDCLTSGMLQC